MFDIGDIILYLFLFAALYAQVFLLFTFLESKSTKKSKLEENKISPDRFPTVSIIVPCFNEEKTLTGTVESLLNLNYPEDKLDIIIVDDGSTDSTYEVAKKFVQNPRVRVFSKENGGKHTALNFGISQTQSELIGCLDADSFADKEALQEIVRVFIERPEVMAVTPSIRVFNPENMLQRMQRVEYNMGVFLRKMFGELNAIQATPGPLSILRRTVFETLGLYRAAHNTEDMEIALRMHKNHYPIANAPRAFVYTVTPRTVTKLYKQRRRWLYGFLKNVLDYRTLVFNPKYGNLGMFSLPTALISILAEIYFTCFMIYYFCLRLADKIVEYSTIGFHLPRHFSFDWFYVNTGTTTLIAYGLLFSGVIFILSVQRSTEGKLKIHNGYFSFFFLYGFIAPFWLFSTLWNVLFLQKNSWR